MVESTNHQLSVLTDKVISEKERREEREKRREKREERRREKRE